MAKGTITEFTDVRALPRWQKFTVMAIIIVVAASFVVAPVMLVVFEEMVAPKTPAGEIGGHTVSMPEFQQVYTVVRLYSYNDALFPTVTVRDPLLDFVTDDPFDPAGVHNSGWTLPRVLERRYLRQYPGADRDQVSEDVLGRVTWTHMLLRQLAREAGVRVADREVSETARLVVVGPRQQWEPEQTAPPEGEDYNAWLDRQAAERRTAEAMLAAEREREYTKRLRERLRMSADTFEPLVEEFLMVKRWVESRFELAGQTTSEVLLEALRASRRLMRGQYIRVPVFNPRTEAQVAFDGELPAGLGGAWQARLRIADGQLHATGHISADDAADLRAAAADPAWHAAIDDLAGQLQPWHPEVDRRARERLAYDRALAGVRRNLTAGTALSSDVLFPDPVREHAMDRLTATGSAREDDNYHESRYRLAVISATYEDISRYVPVEYEQIRRYYETYKDEFYRGGIDRETEEGRAEIDRIVDERKQALIDEHGEDYEPDEGWNEWRVAQYDTLEYRPLAEVEEEIRAHLREIGGEPLGQVVIRTLHDHIQERIRSNTDARGHAAALSERTRDAAVALDVFYWGDPDVAEVVGLVPAADELEQAIDAAVASLLVDAGLSDDPTGDDAGDDGNGPIALDGTVPASQWRDALATFHRAVAVDAWRAFVNGAQLGEQVLQRKDNALAAVEEQLLAVRRSIAMNRAVVERTDAPENRGRPGSEVQRRLDAVKELELLEITEAGLVQRREAIRTQRAAWVGLQQQLDRMTSEPANDALRVTGEGLPRLVLEETVFALADRLHAAIAATRAASDVERQADAARQARLEADSAHEQFEEATERVVKDLREEFPPHAALGFRPEEYPVSLRELGFGLTMIENHAEYPGALYYGLGAIPGVPSFSVRSGLTLEQIADDEQLKARLPFFNDATVWDLSRNEPGAKSLAEVVRGLTPGAWSEPLGVKGVGLYMVMLLDKYEPPVPAPEEVEDRALDDVLEGLRVEVAREMAGEIHARVNARADELATTAPDELARQLARVRDAIAGRVPDGGLLAADAEWTAAAIDALVQTLRGEEPGADMISAMPGVLEAGVARLHRAAAEARNLLIGHAMLAIADRYDLPLATTEWFAEGEELPDIQLGNSDQRMVDVCLTLEPWVALGRPEQETFPPGADDIDAPAETRRAFLLVRSLGTAENDRPGSAVALTDLSPERLEAMRNSLHARRVAGMHELQRLTDLGALIAWFESELQVPVRIYTFKPEF